MVAPISQHREREISFCKPWCCAPRMDFVGFVNMVLLNQGAENSISRFRLQINNLPFINFSFIFINIWISTAVARNVRVPDLDMSPLLSTKPVSDDSDDDDVVVNESNEDYHDYEFHLPDALYTCGTLEVLKLKGAFLVKPPSVISLPKLTVMELKSVRYESDESFCRIISGCRMLHSLAVHGGHVDDGMTVCLISSSGLKQLRYCQYCCWNCDLEVGYDLKLILDTPALEYLYLSDSFMEEVIVRGLKSLNEVALRISYEQPESLWS